MRENNSKVDNNPEFNKTNTPGWLITFDDLLTLLMVFFILVFAMGNINAQKSKKMISSFQSALGVLKEGKRVGIQVVNPPQPAEQPDSNASDDRDTGSRFSEKSQEAIDDLSKNPAISIIQKNKELFITLSDHILFQSGIAELRPEGYPVLDKVIHIVRSNNLRVRIEGHTDNVPIRGGRFPSNCDLSIARAVHVVKYFIDTGQIAPDRLSAVGYGESKPLYPNDSPTDREKNRRVEIILEMIDS